MLSIRNYKKSYNNHLLLEVPSLQLDHGIYWIRGENGAGKSTFFKSISGIISFEGECQIDGVNVKKAPKQYRSMVGYSEAEPIFPDFLTQKDIVKFVVKTKGASHKQVVEISEKLSTASYDDQKVSTYSSGMLKKIGLTLAFLGTPKLIVLDEPFITIDSQSTQALVDLIRYYHSNGTSFLISSHVQEGGEDLEIRKTFQIQSHQLLAL